MLNKGARALASDRITTLVMYTSYFIRVSVSFLAHNYESKIQNVGLDHWMIEPPSYYHYLNVPCYLIICYKLYYDNNF